MQAIRKPDLNAPRFRKNVKRMATIENLKKFKEKYRSYEDLDYKSYKTIIEKHCELIRGVVIDTRDGIELPEGIGNIFIGACPQRKKQIVDYKKSLELGYKVTNMNFATDGTLGKIFYTNYNSKYKIKDRDMWAFNAVRQFKRALGKTYPDNWKLYLSIDSSKPVSSLYFNPRKYVDRSIDVNDDSFDLVLYNEFEF